MTLSTEDQQKHGIFLFFFFFVGQNILFSFYRAVKKAKCLYVVFISWFFYLKNFKFYSSFSGPQQTQMQTQWGMEEKWAFFTEKHST